MRWPDPLGRRRLDDAVRSLEQATAETRRAADEARIALERAEWTGRSVAIALQNSQREDASGSGSFLVFLVFLAILIGAVITTTSLSAFSDPVPRILYPGTVNLLIKQTEREQRGDDPTVSQNATAYISADYDQSANSASYDMYLPAAVAGRAFVLALTGSAVLSNPLGDGSVTFQSSACPNIPRGSSDTGESCELITGTVPTKRVSEVTYQCAIRTKDLPDDVVRISIGGSTALQERPDWAHHLINIPGIGNGFNPEPSPATMWHGQDLHGSYVTPIQAPCAGLNVNRGEIVISSSGISQPHSGPENHLQWDSDGSSEGVVVVTKKYFAGEFGNGLLAFGTAVIALGLGFIPVVYQESMQRRRLRKRPTKRSRPR